MQETDALIAGEMLIDFLPDRPGSLSSVETFHRRAGGAPANVAVGLSKLRAPPLFWTRVGSDPFGDYLVDTLRSHDVPETFVERDPAAQTSLAFVSHDENADREFSFYREDTADTQLQADTVPDSVLESIQWVHFGGVTLATEPARTASLDLAARARDAECTVSFDPNARPELWPGDDSFERVTRHALELADVVKATPEDLRAAGSLSDDPNTLAQEVLDEGPHTVLLTRGRKGALAVATASAPWGPAEVILEGYDVQAVDTTGAGDAFTAGALAAFLDGESDLEAVLSFANAVGALVTTEPGAMAAIPKRETVVAFQQKKQ